ncbi:MAG: DUF4340 domain-containing protein [Clostridia bacterium]|nr:DUF4340 domain-containing protein [Clostridia bacterium]
MSPVRRRGVRARGKAWLWALLAGGLALLGGLWLWLGQEAAVPPPEPQPDTTVLLADRSTEDLCRLEIRNPYDAYALVKDENGDWQMEGYPGFVFRETMLDAMLANAVLLVADDTVCDLAAGQDFTLADFGLEDNVFVRAEFTDGTALAFRVGALVMQEVPAYYLYLEGDTRVFTVSEDVRDSYSYTRMALHAVSDPALNGELIDRVAFTGSDPFTLERRADGWYVTEPVVYPLSDGAVDALLEKLEGLRFAQFVAKEDEADLDSFGLSPARRALTLDIAPSVVTGYDENGRETGQAELAAYQLTFALGDADTDVTFYCLYRGEVVRMTTFTCGFLLTQGYESLLSPAPFNAPTNDLLSLTVDGKTYEISLRERVLPNNEFERDADGNVLYDVAVSREGIAVDSEAFLTAYRALLSLRTTDRLPDGWQIPDGAEPVWAASFTRESMTRTVALYPCDALHDAVAVDGAALFRVEKGWGEGISWP